MPNRRDVDALSAANFHVEIEGVDEVDVFSVAILDHTTAVIETDRGNDPITRKTPGRHRYGDIVLRRRWDGTNTWWDWRKAVVDGRVERRAGSIIILGATRARANEVGRFNFFEGWPSGWSLGPLDAGVDAPLVETLTVTVEKLERG